MGQDRPLFAMTNGGANRSLSIMHKTVAAFSLCCLLPGLPGCEKQAVTGPSSGSQAMGSPSGSPRSTATEKAHPESSQSQFDACALMTKEEVEAIQQSAMKETKSSTRPDGAFRLSQCFYTAGDFNRSVTLAGTQSDPQGKVKRSPRDFWKETFGRYSGDEKEGEQDRSEKARKPRHEEEEKESIPPTKITDIGDEAFWTGGTGGTLYVLRKDVFIRISVGGADTEETKLAKSRALAQLALSRL